MKKDIVNKNDKNQLHGIQIGYWSNGQIRHKYNYINGKLHGELIGYYKNGQIRYKENCINGEYHGEKIGYYENGQIWHKQNYINGKMVSPEEWIAYNRKLKMS
jgi:antitoxin component YwqK of YwqJK toxin-antitoxin module